jgi:diaphanous 1
MSDNPLIVPVLLVTGTLHFAEIQTDGKAQDVVDVLLREEGIKAETLGDLEESEWALQRVRVEEAGRPWEEDELMSLGDGELLRISRSLRLVKLYVS